MKKKLQLNLQLFSSYPSPDEIVEKLRSRLETDDERRMREEVMSEIESEIKADVKEDKVQSAAKSIGDYIKRAYENHTRFKEEQQRITTEYKNGDLSVNKYNESLEQSETQWKVKNEKLHSDITDRLPRFYEEELKKIQADRDGFTLTQNDILELQLLSDVEVDQADIDKFAQRFKHSPLALKKIREVANKNDLSDAKIPLNREEAAENIFDKLKESIDYWYFDSTNDYRFDNLNFFGDSLGEQEKEWAAAYREEYDNGKNLITE